MFLGPARSSEVVIKSSLWSVTEYGMNGNQYFGNVNKC